MGILISLLILVIVAGIVYWIVTLLPLPQPFKNIVIVILLLILLLWILGMFTGYFPVAPLLRR